MKHTNRLSYDILFAAVRDNLPVNQRAGPFKYTMDFERLAAQAFMSVFHEAEESDLLIHLNERRQVKL